MTRKYEYWHYVTWVDKDFQKTHPNIKVGVFATNNYKTNGGITITNFETGKEWEPAYTLEYVKRIPVNSTSEEKIKIFEEWKQKRLEK